MVVAIGGFDKFVPDAKLEPKFWSKTVKKPDALWDCKVSVKVRVTTSSALGAMTAPPSFNSSKSSATVYVIDPTGMAKDGSKIISPNSVLSKYFKSHEGTAVIVAQTKQASRNRFI